MTPKIHPSSKRYPELHKLPWSPNWVFRRFSKEKGKEFVKSTGIAATEKDAAAAYKKGLELFDEWLGAYLPSGRRQVLIRDLSRAVLAAKETKRKNTYRSAKNQIENHVNPSFGHLRPEQITRLRWEAYISDEKRKGKRTKFYNTRKALREILIRAHEEGMIKSVPKLPLDDGEAAPPRFIPKEHMLRILKRASRRTKLLVFIMWKQGARPSEILQYRFSMIDWGNGPHGHIAIPGSITKTKRDRTIPLNPKVSRILKWLAGRVDSDLIFPSPTDPERAQAGYMTGWRNAVKAPGRRRPGQRVGKKTDWSKALDYTPYNCRDTWITNSLKRGISSTFIGKYSDTSPTMIDRRYAVAERQAMEGLADENS